MIRIVSQKFTDEFEQNGPSDFLFGNVGDRISVTTEVEAFEEVSGIGVKRCATDFTKLQRTDGSKSWEELPFLVGDKVGFQYTGTSGTLTEFTILDMEGDWLKADISFTDLTTSIDMWVTTPLKGVKYYYNLSRNEDTTNNFNSLIDGIQQRFEGAVGDAGFASALPAASTSKAWQNGTVVATYNGRVGRRDKFTFLHTFYITPFYLPTQINETADGKVSLSVPDYFANAQCLKYVVGVGVSAAANAPENRFYGVYSKAGNTGWFNEKFNGGAPSYIKSTLTYRSGGAAITSLGTTQATEINFSLFRQDSSSVIGNKGVFHICKLKEEFDGSKVLFDNLSYDRVSFVVPPTFTQFGQGGQISDAILPGITIGSPVSTVAQVKVFIKAGYLVKGEKYAIWCTLHDDAATTVAASNRTAVLLDTALAYQKTITYLWEADPDSAVCLKAGVSETTTVVPTGEFEQVLGLVPVGAETSECLSVLSGARVEENDYNAFLFKSGVPLGFALEQIVGGTVIDLGDVANDNTGKYYPLSGGYTGKVIDWQKVLNQYGIGGTFRLRVFSSSVVSYSPWFKLDVFTAVSSNQTVRLEVKHSGTVGNYKLPYEWLDSVRVTGFFGRPSFRPEEELITYDNGLTDLVNANVAVIYRLSFVQVMYPIVYRFGIYATIADKIYVSDYNFTNPDKNLFLVSVRNTGEIRPIYWKENPYCTFTIDMRQVDRNYAKKYC